MPQNQDPRDFFKMGIQERTELWAAHMSQFFCYILGLKTGPSVAGCMPTPCRWCALQKTIYKPSYPSGKEAEKGDVASGRDPEVDSLQFLGETPQIETSAGSRSRCVGSATRGELCPCKKDCQEVLLAENGRLPSTHWPEPLGDLWPVCFWFSFWFLNFWDEAHLGPARPSVARVV